MIAIYPLREKDKLKDFYDRSNIAINDASMAVVASDGDEIIGFCLFDMNKDTIVVNAVCPQDDIMFADGLLRSALHVGVENGIMKAFYSEDAPQDLFRRLRFIKDEASKELNVNMLFSSCENC